ncbi:MAG: cytochrome C oxidase subunit II [Deltaproteobacteria bacterium]|nr:cytochrome C oxidase subunit II [Deltaproteobacteria bacterium]
MHSGIVSPKGVWWTPAGKQEKLWVTIAFVWCMVLFAMMPFWHIKGGQNPAGVRTRVDPSAFSDRVDRFNQEFRVGEEKGFPVVAPPPGADVYLMGSMWQWSSVLRLEKGASYMLHLSSADMNHGFSLYPVNLNLQVVPGYDYALKITPNQAGEFRVICNEYCGADHHNMVGRIVVVEPGGKEVSHE